MSDLRSNGQGASADASTRAVEDALARVASGADQAPASGVPEAADAMFAELEAAIEARNREPLAGIHDLATPLRMAIAVGSTLLAVFGFGISACRPDLGEQSMGRFVAEVALLTAALVTTLVLALRPIWRPALPRAAAITWILVTLGLAVVIALVPGAAPPAAAPAAELGPLAPRHWAGGLPCVSIGLFVGIPIYLLARLFDRGQRASTWLAAATAGVASNLALALHCPSGDVLHKLGSHASLGFIFLGCLGLAAWIESVLPGRGARH